MYLQCCWINEIGTRPFKYFALQEYSYFCFSLVVLLESPFYCKSFWNLWASSDSKARFILNYSSFHPLLFPLVTSVTRKRGIERNEIVIRQEHGVHVSTTLAAIGYFFSSSFNINSGLIRFFKDLYNSKVFKQTFMVPSCTTGFHTPYGIRQEPQNDPKRLWKRQFA